MPDMLAIAQGLNALKATTDIIKAMAGLRDAAQILEKTVELNQKILTVQTALADAQAEQTTLIQTIRHLEEDVTRLKTWEAEKQRYELKEVAPRTFAYVLKPNAGDPEPPHWICASCYQKTRSLSFKGKNGMAADGYIIVLHAKPKLRQILRMTSDSASSEPVYAAIIWARGQIAVLSVRMLGDLAGGVRRRATSSQFHRIAGSELSGLFQPAPARQAYRHRVLRREPERA